jgi:hypothetical protein
MLEVSNLYNGITNYIIFIGAILSIVGFIFWYIKLQRYQDLLIKEKYNSFKKS